MAEEDIDSMADASYRDYLRQSQDDRLEENRAFKERRLREALLNIKGFMNGLSEARANGNDVCPAWAMAELNFIQMPVQEVLEKVKDEERSANE